MRLDENRQAGSHILIQPDQAQRQQRVNQPDGRFLSAHPIGAGVRRIAPPPVLHPEPHCRKIARVPAYSPGAGKDQRPTETGHLPDNFDVSRLSVKVCNFAPMQRGVRVSLILKWVQEPIRRVSDVIGVYRKVVRPSLE